MWGQSEISYYCFCAWCESRELGGFEIFLCNHIDRNLLLKQSRIRILSNINDGAPLRKQSAALTRLTVSARKLDHRPPTGFQMRI